MPDGVLATVERPRCAQCGDEVSPDERAPCPECGALLHGRCYVEAGGCPTLGCSNAAEGLIRQPRTAMAIREARRLRASRTHAGVAMAGIACGASGAAGMTTSFLAMSAAMQGVVAGSFGFVAGAVLVTTGVVVLTIAAIRPPPRADGRRAPGSLGIVAGVVAGLALAAGIGGMGLSFLVIAVGSIMEIVAAGAGFAAGALLVFGGAVSSALLALGRDPPEE